MDHDPDFRTAVTDRITLDVHLNPTDDEAEVAELRAGLMDRRPREISSRYFYDETGSRLFDRICDLPEYYQTRTERKLLSHIADTLVRRNGSEELLELGSGMATKTRVLLDAMQRAGKLRQYLPFDVSHEILLEVADELTDEYPDLHVHAILGDFNSDLDYIPHAHNRMVAFLGGTIGNLHPTQAVQFLRNVSHRMGDGDHLLLGTDLIKNVDRLEAAYNDSEGVTADFNRNILRVVNRRLKADFDPERFAHRAFYDREHNRIEMRLVSRRKQVVWIGAFDLSLHLAEGEEIRTEISVKYDRERASALLDAAGFLLEDFYTDEDDLFGLAVARRTS